MLRMRSLALAPVPFLLASATLMLFAGCSSNSLDGSVKARFDLTFSKVEIIKQVVDPNTYLAIQYDNGNTKPCKLTLNVTGLNLPRSNAVISGPDFVNAATFKRIANDPNDYATLLSGKVTFSQYSLTTQAEISGEFTAVFQDSYDIIGDFKGPVISN